MHTVRRLFQFLVVVYVASGCMAQTGVQPPPVSATVPVTLDHNRIVIDVRFPLPDGTTKRVRAWVDSGDPDMWIAEDLAKALNLEMSGEAKEDAGSKVRTSLPPATLIIGGMQIHPTELKAVKVLLDRDAIAPGMSAKINLPSRLLRHYDIQMDYLNREFTIAMPGELKFAGSPAKASVNAENGLIQLPAVIDGKSMNLGLDLGASFSLVSTTVVSDLQKAHPQWPHMTGAVGPANLWGVPREMDSQVLRVPAIEYGGATLAQVGIAAWPQQDADWFEKRAGMPTAGLIGANALLNYRVGVDYIHGKVYLEQTSKHRAPEMDVIGLTLRPEPDERYTVVGVAQYAGKPSVPEVRPGDVLVSIDKVPAAGGTMGQVWSLLSGRVGETRTLTLERSGKQFTVTATIHCFLDAAPMPGTTKH